jgi:hypothetical protein
LTAADWTTFNSKGSGTIGGSSTATQISFGDTTANEITSSSNLQFLSNQNLYVGGRIQIGNATGTKLTTVSSQDLILDTNEGTDSGNITIQAGTNGQISITPDGTGIVKIDGVGINNSAIATGYILKATSTTEAGWVAESGGGFTGSLADTQVAFGNTTADSIQGSSDFTFGSNILKIGGASSSATFTSGGTGFTKIGVNSGSSSEAFIFLSSGSSGNLQLNAGGTGTASPLGVVQVGQSNMGVEISRAYTLPKVVTAANDYVLTAQTDGSTAWAAAGGGGSPGGSDTQIQYNNGGSFGGSSVMTFDDTGSAEQVLFSGTSSKAIFKVEQLGAGNSIEVHDAATDTTIFLVDQYGRAAIKTNAVSSGYDLTVGGSTFVQGHLKLSTVGTTSAPAIKWDGDTTTGINKPSTGEIAIVASGTETFRFGANNDLEIAGNAGTSGQVLTSGGAGAAASWTTPSGGSSIWNQVNTKNNINSSYRRFLVSKSAPWGSYSTGSSTTGSVDTPHCRPFIAPVSGDVTEIGVNVTTADATATTKLSIGIYSDSNGAPDSLLTLAVMNSTSTGSSFQTSFAGTATLSAGTQYWYVWVRNNSTNSIGFSAESNSGLVWVGASSTVSAGMNQQSVLSLSSSNNTLPATITQSNLSPSFYGAIKLGLKIA